DKLIEIDVPRAELPQAYYLAASIESEASGDLLGFHPDAMRLVCLLAGKVQSGKRSLNPLDLEAQLNLNPDSLFILTDFIGENNRLHWQAPKGYWKIIGVYAGPSGERPIYSATTEPGYLVNPLDSGRNLSHLNAVLKGQNGYPRVVGNALRGISSGPYQYHAERLFSNDLPAYFEANRGYPLLRYLPALLVPAGHNTLHNELRWPRKSWFQLTEEDERIRYDYQKTISELLLERELSLSQNWALQNGLHQRKQTGGLAIDLIEAAGKADIPEAKQAFAGGSRLFLKLISSGAHLYDRPLVSALSFGHRDKQFQFSPQMFKAGADKLFLAGFNQLVYQGTSYPMPLGDGQFWHPFKKAQAPFAAQATDFGSSSVFFPHWGTLNQYVSRCQYILRQGKPVSEALVFYPFLGFPASFSQAKGFQEWYFNGDLPPWSEASPRRAAFEAFGQEEIAPIPRLDWYQKADEMLTMLEN
ncbi:MAG: glycosyl hydrolase, partial [Bacteroidota bacterium]